MERPPRQRIWEEDYSRLTASVGVDALRRFQGAALLVVGMTGLGVEVAKNLAVMGASLIAIHDDELISWNDLSSNFLINQGHVGKPRAASVVEPLRDFNPNIDVKLLSGDISDVVIRPFNAVICTNQHCTQLLQLSDLCRTLNIPIIISNTWGLFGFAFSDFGDSVIMSNVTGMSPQKGFITSISQTGIVTSDVRHDLASGDVVRIEEVRGMVEINDAEFPITVQSSNSFHLFPPHATPPLLSTFISGGKWTQIKRPATFSFKSWRECTTSSPPAPPPLGRLQTLDQHVQYSSSYFFTMLALQQFEASHHHLPASLSSSDAAEVVSLAKSFATGDALDEALVMKICKQASSNISPITSIFGGIAAHEAMKAVTNTQTPLQQFFFFDALQVLPDSPLTIENVAPQQCRYDGLISVLGRDVFARIQNARLFQAGCGALGCELLKNWAMIGLGTGPVGLVTVADHDVISRHNLPAHFLFRERNIKQLKVQVGAAQAQAINNEMHVEACSSKITQDERAYDHAFWRKFPLICSAVDNISTRLLLDSKCLEFEHSLLEAGFSGLLGSTQVTLPHATQLYGDTEDAPPSSIPHSKISFPTDIDDITFWAQVFCSRTFYETPKDCISFLNQFDFLSKSSPHSRVGLLESFISLLKYRQTTFDGCIQWARLLFDTWFTKNIQRLLQQYPADYIGQHGLPFWTPPRNAPHVVVFDPTNIAHVDFVAAAAFLRACIFNLVDRELLSKPLTERRAHIAAVAAAGGGGFSEPSWGPEMDDEIKVKILLKELPSRLELRGIELNAIEMSEDDGLVVDLLYVTSCIRAEQFSISPPTRWETCSRIFKVIPAIATTTAVTAGLLSLELLKLLQGKKKESHRNNFINLALGRFIQAEPLPPKKMIGGRIDINSWTVEHIRCKPGKDVTLAQILALVETKYRARVDILSVRTSMIYASWRTKNPSLTEPLLSIMAAKRIAGKESQPAVLYVTGATIDGDDDCDIPQVLVWWD